MTNTDRLFKTNKVITIPFSGVTSTQVLADALGNIYQNISDVFWSRIVLEWNLTTLSGTSPTVSFSLITTNDQSNGGSTTDSPGKQGDGATAISSGTLSGVGRGSVGAAKQSTSGASASNVGKFAGVLATVGGTVTACAGTIFLYVEGQ